MADAVTSSLAWWPGTATLGWHSPRHPVGGTPSGTSLLQHPSPQLVFAEVVDVQGLPPLAEDLLLLLPLRLLLPPLLL